MRSKNTKHRLRRGCITALFACLTAPNSWSTPVGPIDVWLDEYQNFRFRFEHDPMRRFTIEESSDLATWSEHWVSPAKSADDEGSGYTTGGIGTRTSYFLRFRQLPWLFEPVTSSADWLGDFRVRFKQDGTLVLLYQNRTTNTLYITNREDPGTWSDGELVATTGVPDFPSFWDNNGYHGVQFFILPDGTYLLTCVDQYNGEIICLSRASDESEWARHSIASGFSVPAWVMTTSAVSTDGTLGIAYADGDGFFLYTGPIGDIALGNVIPISTESPAGHSAILFTGPNEVLVQMGSRTVRIDLVSREVTQMSIPGKLLSSIASDGTIASTTVLDNGIIVYRSEDSGATWDSNYIELGELDGGVNLLNPDGRVATIASWYSRLIVHTTTETGELNSLRIANGADAIGDFFQFPDGKFGLILARSSGTRAVTLARQE